MAHAISIPIYPKEDTYVSQLFNYIKHQTKYTILKIISEFQVKELSLYDRVYQGICYIATPQSIWIRIANTINDKTTPDIFDLAHFIELISPIIQNREKKGDTSLSSWVKQLNNLQREDSSKNKPLESLSMGAIAILNIIGEIILNNNSQEMTHLGIKRKFSEKFKF